MEAALNTPSGRTALGPTPVRIGRAPDNTLVVTDPESSSHHAEVAPGYRGNGYQITDLNSTNGTFVNEQRIPANTPRPLSAGDVIRIGQTRISYEVTGSYIPTLPANTPSYEPTVAASPYATPPAPAASPSVSPPPPPTPYTPPPSYPAPAAQAYPPPQPAATPYPAPAAYPAQAYPQPQPAAAPYPAPAYPQPPQYQPPYPQYPQGQAYPPARKKGRAGLVVVIVLVLVILLGGGGVYLYLQNRSTPQKTLAAYCDGWKTGNAQEIFDQFSTHVQSGSSVAAVQKGIDFTKLVGGVTDCEVSDVTQNGSTATGVVTLTLGGKATHATEDLVLQNGVWKINNSTSSSANSL